jgi:hypothetical protein
MLVCLLLCGLPSSSLLAVSSIVAQRKAACISISSRRLVAGYKRSGWGQRSFQVG